jgi:hypothetical protein
LRTTERQLSSPSLRLELAFSKSGWRRSTLSDTSTPEFVGNAAAENQRASAVFRSLSRVKAALL